MSNCCSHGNLPHFSLQDSHLTTCYSHQDLRQEPFHLGLRDRFLHSPHAPLHVAAAILQRRRDIGGSLERHPFSGLVHSAGELLHSCADFDFHDHRPAVKMNQHPLWFLMSEHFGTLTPH